MKILYVSQEEYDKVYKYLEKKIGRKPYSVAVGKWLLKVEDGSI